MLSPVLVRTWGDRLRLMVARVCFGVFAVLAFLADPAAAQETTTTTPAPEAGASGVIRGTFMSGSTPIEGVTITAEAVDVAADPDFSGEATSDADGNWAIEVPGPGRYHVAIDVDTIPEGFELEDETRFELPQFQVFPGSTSSNAVFRFASEEGGREAPSRWERMVNLIFSGIRLGLIIGVCSVGLSVVFGTTGLVNFAQGELVTLGALLAWFLNTSSGGPQWTLVFATIVAVILSGLFGGGLDLVLWRPMVKRRSGPLARMLVSIGLALFLRYLFQVLTDGSPNTFRQYATQGPTKVGPLSFPINTYIIMGICLVVLLGVGFILQKTRLGTAIRALADEKDLAEASGINVRRVITIIWIGSTALAGLGGILLGITQTVQFNMGFRLLLTMFAAVVLGGLGSAYGAMVGGLVVGVASEVSTYWIDADFKYAIGLAILIAVLMVRPQGILGIKERVG